MVALVQSGIQPGFLCRLQHPVVFAVRSVSFDGEERYLTPPDPFLSFSLSWVGAVGLMYNHVITKDLASFNAEAQRRDPKWKAAQTPDDLARMKEGDFLDIIATQPLSIIGKNVKEELKNNCLQLRNACGHPSSLVIGENKVAAHLEILILNVFSRFS